MSDFFPNEIMSFISWLKSFVLGVKNNKDVLSISEERIAELESISEELELANTELHQLKTAHKAATKKKDELKKRAIKVVRKNTGMFQADFTVPAPVLKGIGLNPHKKTRSFEVPSAPTGCTAQVLSATANLITWKPGGNKRHTMYHIEFRYHDEEKFRYLYGTTATRYTHTHNKPGIPVYYRIFARRGKLESSYSNTAGVYL